MKGPQQGERHRPAVWNPGEHEHSGSAPRDLEREGPSIPVKAKNGKLTNVVGTWEREAYYAAHGLPVPVDGSTDDAREEQR